MDFDKYYGLFRRKELRIFYEDSLFDGERKLRKRGKIYRSYRIIRNDFELSLLEILGYERYRDRRRYKCFYSLDDFDFDDYYRRL